MLSIHPHKKDFDFCNKDLDEINSQLIKLFMCSS